MGYIVGGLDRYGKGIISLLELVMRLIRACLVYVETSSPYVSNCNALTTNMWDSDFVPFVDSFSDDKSKLESITSNDSFTIELQESHLTPFVQPTLDSSPSTFRS